MLGLALILVFGIGAQWLAWRLRLPSILLLLFTGIVVGPLTGWLDPDRLLGDLLLPAVSLSVGLILFEGGLGLRLADLAGMGAVVRNLVTVGALVTWVIAAGAAKWVAGLSTPLAVLLGAILVVTGPTVIGPLLRYVRPVGKVGPILKWEGTVIDPIGALLAVLVFHAIPAGNFHAAAPGIVKAVLMTVGIGCSVGLVAALLLMLVLRRFWVPDYLQNPVSLTIVVAAFVASNLLQADSGLFTAVVIGVFLANTRDVQIRHIVEFKENLSVLLVSGLFIVLAARLKWEHLAQTSIRGLLFVAVLVLIARPLAVLVSSARSGLTWRERAFLAWMAPRGIVAASVSSVFALRLQQNGMKGADVLVSLTFLVIIATVTIYALSSSWLARRLGLARAGSQGFVIAGANPVARTIGKALRDAGIEVLLVDTNRDNIREARAMGLPTYLGSVLSERVLRRIELGGIGRLLALTPSDEVNALSAVHFAKSFGRSEVYQLASPGQPGGRGEAVASDLHGRVIADAALIWRALSERFAAGAAIQRVPLSDDLGYAQVQEGFGSDVLPLFLVDEVEAITILTAGLVPVTRPGQALLALVNPAVALPRTPETARESLLATGVR